MISLMSSEPARSTSVSTFRSAGPPVEIEKRWGHQLDAVVDGGSGIPNPTTVVDLRSEPYEILREGQGDVSQL